MSSADDAATTAIALAIGSEETRDFLAKLVGEQNASEITDAVPDRTDICLVDEAGLSRADEALARWRNDQHPRFAPVLLLAESATENPWESYADALSDRVGAIVQIPTPKSAITARIENLLEMRSFSQKLAAEHQLTERVFDTSPVAKVVLDTAGTVVRANQRAEALLGFSGPLGTDGDASIDDCTAIDEDGSPIPAEDRPFRRVFDTGAPIYGYEHGIERPDSEPLWVSVNMAPIRDESGGIEYVVGAFEDITVRRDRKQQLERQVDLFERAQDIANVGAWEYDVRTGDAYWTAETARIHGLPADADPSPELSLQYFHPEDRPVIESAFERAIEAGEPYDLELRLTDANGTERWVRTRGEPQYEGGELIRVRGTIQDISDRKDRELQIEQMRRAVSKAPLGITLSDPSLDDNPIIYVNDGFVELTGYERDEVIGRNCRFLQGANTDEATVATIRRAIDSEESVSVVIRNYRADGTVFWNSLDIAPIRDESGAVINYIGFQQDVTDRMERQRQLQTLDRYLRHNLRNDMTVVQGLAELIQADGEPPLTEYAEQIETTSTALVESMEKERQITRILKDEPTSTTVELMSTLQSLVAAVRQHYPDAAVSVSGPDTVHVQATDQLSSAMGELLSNGLAHNDSATPHLTIEVTPDTDDVAVRITDNGPGIPEMEVEVLTGQIEETEMYHGQGLGLWLVYLIVRRSGGRIEFEDGAGGSTVTVLLPRRRAQD